MPEFQAQLDVAESRIATRLESCKRALGQLRNEPARRETPRRVNQLRRQLDLEFVFLSCDKFRAARRHRYRERRYH